MLPFHEVRVIIEYDSVNGVGDTDSDTMVVEFRDAPDLLACLDEAIYEFKRALTQTWGNDVVVTDLAVQIEGAR